MGGEVSFHVGVPEGVKNRLLKNFLYFFILTLFAFFCKNAVATTEESVSKKTNGSQTYGFVFSVPCGFEGYGKLNFKKERDSTNYFSITKMHPQCPPLEEAHRFVTTVYFKEGNWEIDSISLFERKKISASDYKKLEVLVNGKSLSSNESSFVSNVETASEKISGYSFEVSDETDDVPFHYFGQVQALSSGSSYSFDFNKQFDIRYVRKFFKQKKVFNAYSNERLRFDKILGDIHVTVKTVGNSQKFSESKLLDLKNEIMDVMAECIKKEDKVNPIISLNAKIYINVSNGKLITKDSSFKFRESGKSSDRVENCLSSGFKGVKASFNETVSLEAIIDSL